MSSVGNFVVPTPNRTSELVNDTRFSSIQEYILTPALLGGSSVLSISDIGVGATIYKIDLIVFKPFITGDTATLAVKTLTNEILMDIGWNDPSTVGSYVTDCYYVSAGLAEEIKVNHTLGRATEGMALLRFYLYNNAIEYVNLLTNNNLQYHSSDGNKIQIIG